MYESTLTTHTFIISDSCAAIESAGLGRYENPHKAAYIIRIKGVL